jgi:ABC-type nitrate/sulfonate/bicarbonate transport system permease component
LVTVQEIVLGFLLALVMGVGLGVLLHSSRMIERAVYPWLVVSQLVPIPAIAPVFVIWFGFDLRPKILVVALVSFFPIVVNTIDGLKAVEPELVNLMRTLRAPRWRIFLSAQLPAAMPFIFSGMKIASALAVIGAVFGEWVGASQGLGYLILVFNNQTNTAAVFAVVTVLAVIGIGLFGLISLIERLALPWYHKPRSQGNAV